MDLFPEITPYRQGYLPVSRGHELYFEEVGNPQGKPVLYLHGGPGAGLSPKHRRYFHPGFWRVILFDQRGAGQSRPHASVEGNTTWDLVEDMERLRAFLGVQTWSLFGGSWGSTLALCYAIQHRKAVEALMLRGIFLGTDREVHWLYQDGASRFFPEAYQAYTSSIPEPERYDLIAAFSRKLMSENRDVALAAAKAWSTWEMTLAKLLPDPSLILEFQADNPALSLARLENHYCRNRFFLPKDGWILENVGALQDIPCRIVHGRYDMTCPPESAFALHQALPRSEWVVVQDAGHSASDPSLMSALAQMAWDFQKVVGGGFMGREESEYIHSKSSGAQAPYGPHQ